MRHRQYLCTVGISMAVLCVCPLQCHITLAAKWERQKKKLQKIDKQNNKQAVLGQKGVTNEHRHNS